MGVASSSMAVVSSSTGVIPGVALSSIGCGVRLVTDALVEVKRCCQELSAVARSGSIFFQQKKNIIDDMELLELGKTVIPFVVVISVWTFSKIMRQSSYVLTFMSSPSSFEPWAWNVSLAD
jgi:hypothetical protein